MYHLPSILGIIKLLELAGAQSCLSFYYICSRQSLYFAAPHPRFNPSFSENREWVFLVSSDLRNDWEHTYLVAKQRVTGGRICVF